MWKRVNHKITLAGFPQTGSHISRLVICDYYKKDFVN